MLLSTPVTEVQIPEADRHLHAHLLRALRPVWPTTSVEHAREPEGQPARPPLVLAAPRRPGKPLYSHHHLPHDLSHGPPSVHPLSVLSASGCGAKRPVAASGPRRRRPEPSSPQLTVRVPASARGETPARRLLPERPLVPPRYEELFPEYTSQDRVPPYYVLFPDR